MILWFVVGLISLAVFTMVELFIAKDPLLDLRLFSRRTFLNASLLGYVSVIALFGAEFLMPIYLQALRGRSAFETGITIIPMAVTGAIATITAGRLYDRIGPRPLVAFGFTILILNTWQLSKIQAATPIGWIMFLLALRGLAIGSTVQTTFVTALSVVPLKEVAHGSSLVNSTRQVVQSIGVAVLSTVLTSTLTHQIAQLQQSQLAMASPDSGIRVALCEPNPITVTGSGDPGNKPSLNFPQVPIQLFREACQENIAGFEQAYRITFYAAFVALFLGILLPGWPLVWAGRRAADQPSHHD